MRTAIFFLLMLAWPILADEGQDLLKRAAALETRAEQLLDAGQRGQAIDLLAKASDLRAKARALKKNPRQACALPP